VVGRDLRGAKRRDQDSLQVELGREVVAAAGQQHTAALALPRELRYLEYAGTEIAARELIETVA
jgi:hypothetical protein